MRPVLHALALGLSVMAAACMLVTGSTDGYSSADSGAGACTSASDCGGGAVCCVSASASSSSIAGSCQKSCTVALPQLCKASSECGDAGPCALQTCTVDGSSASITFHACGTVAGCAASP